MLGVMKGAATTFHLSRHVQVVSTNFSDGHALILAAAPIVLLWEVAVLLGS